MRQAKLLLENGRVFKGLLPDWLKKPIAGELVFTTAMTGYVESLTDPSYAGQILVFTYPLIGSYGMPAAEMWESRQITPSGVVMATAIDKTSHSEMKKTLLTSLREANVPYLLGVDTRELTKSLRDCGSLMGQFYWEGAEKLRLEHPHKRHLVKEFSAKAKRLVQASGEKKVVLVDCGMKDSILRSLAPYPLNVTVVPYDYDYTEDDYDGVLVSNGPGDPKRCQETIAILEKALKKEQVVFGICLGSQLMALASGADSYKLNFGHRGQNHPCIHVETRRCYITSQNHGYAVVKETLARDWKVEFLHLNDHSVAGISHLEKPHFAVQFHPEASPGPLDTKFLFDRFVRAL